MDVLDIGMIPTPLPYYTLYTEAVDAGAMIIGSHNPAEYNGFKLCLSKSTLHGAQIQEIKEIAISGDFECRETVLIEKKARTRLSRFRVREYQARR